MFKKNHLWFPLDARQFGSGASVVTPQSDSENEEISNLALNFYNSCQVEEQNGRTIWLGIKKIDGKWRILESKKQLNYTHFHSDTKDDGNCAFLFTNKMKKGKHGFWGTTPCQNKLQR